MSFHFFLPFLLFIPSAIAQPVTQENGEPLPDLVSDRPDFTESTQVVGTNAMQIEAGFAREITAGPDGMRTISGPFPLIRLGLSRRVEVRFSGDGYAWQSLRATAARGFRGFSDHAVGAKVKLANESGWRPAMAVIGSVSMPVGDPEVSSRHHDPEFKFCWAHHLPAGLDMSGNFNVGSASDERGRINQGGASLSFARELKYGFSGYAEMYSISLNRDEGRSSIFNFGFTHGMGRNAQADFTLGKTITGGVTSWYMAVGVVLRQPMGLVRN
jgi:hypothetical protein